VIATDLVLPQETVSKIGRGAFGLQLGRVAGRCLAASIAAKPGRR